MRQHISSVFHSGRGDKICDINKREMMKKNIKGEFPLSRKSYVRADVNLAGFTYVNKIRSDA